MTDKGRILAVDDTPASLRLLTDLLQDEGYEVRSAIGGELALHAALSNPPELVLLDIRMPGMDGYEVCRRLKADPATCDVPVIFVSAVTETDEKVQGFGLGAVDFVTQPYQRDELMARVRTHLELHRLRHHLEDLVEERTAELRQSEKKLRTSLLDSVAGLAAIFEMRDPYTAGHQRRVAELAGAIAAGLGWDAARIEMVTTAGLLHDVGKIIVPAEILARPGRLSELEMDLIRGHAAASAALIAGIEFRGPVAAIVNQHHERLDGSGYPRGLAGDEIILEARILAVADVVEAMASHRPYRPALGIDAALEEIEQHSGGLYDAEVAAACVELFRRQGFTFASPGAADGVDG